ncbi:hypothetical protein QJQ45_008489 [Haematococcus lacustris]|nr:hypothetical protein QJQ45_008489 [Haematococcus lacustris]
MSEAPQHAKRRMASGLRGTSLPPPLLPSGLGGSSLKKHKTQHKTKSAWVMEQLTAVTAPTSDPDETDGAVNFVLRYMCNHCQDNLAGSNKDRLKRHLLRCSKFLASTQAMNIAKTFSEIAAAIEEYKQENKEVAEVQQDAGTTPNSKSTARAGSGVVEDKGRFAKDLVKLIVDCNLPFNIVDNPTFKTFLATWVPAMPVPSRDQPSAGPQVFSKRMDYAELEQVFSKRMDYGHHVALYLAAVLDPRYRHKPHNLTVEEVLAAEELAAKLASADGKGKDAAGNAARLELLDTWLEPDYAVGMGLTMDRFAPDLTVDPVAWWRRYGKKLPHLQVVAQRVLSIPATSAATERLFSAFKFIWSDRRSRLLLGRMWIMSYVFFNTRVMTRKEHHASAEAQEEWESYMAAQVIKVPEGAVLRGCKKTRRKLREHLQLRAEIHSQLRVIASLFVLRIFLTCLVGYPTPGSPNAPQPPAVQPPQPPDAPPLPPLPQRAPAQPAQPASMECDNDSDSESDCGSEPEPQSDTESEQLKDFCKFFANPNFKTCYNQLQRRLGRNRHPMLMPAFEEPSNQALLAKLQELGSINLAERIVKLYAKAARAKLGWSGEEAQVVCSWMACGYGINAHSSELKAATLDKGHVADLIEEANTHRRLLGMKKQGSLQDTLPLPCRMRHAVHVCRWLERWQQPHTPPAPGQPKRGKRRGVGPRTLTCPPPFTLTPMARVGVHFIKVDSRVLHGVCKQLGLTKETQAAFTSEPALSDHWARTTGFNTNKLRNKEFHFERLVDTDGVSVCVHYTRPLPPPPAPPPAASSSSTSSRPSAAAAAAHAVGLPHIGRGIAEMREFVFDTDTQVGVGIDPGVTQAVSAASGVWDPATGQLKADQLRRWKLTKGEVKHASGLNNARRDTERWLAPIKPHLQHLAAASSVGTSLVANLKHITVTLATWDAVWEVYLDPKWARQRLRLYGAQDRALEQFFNKLEKEMAELSMKRHNRAKQLVVFFGAATIGTGGGWGADAVLRACRKVVCRPRGKDQDGGRVVLVDEHRTSRVSSAVNGKQPCEVELNTLSATRPAGWKPPAGQVHHRLVRPAWSQERGQPVRGLVWCPVVAPRKPPQAPRSSQEATQPAASEPGPSTPQPAKRSKPAAEPTKGKGKAAKAKPTPQPGRWLDRDCNAALNMQRIGESRWRLLELCWWPDLPALPAKGKEYPGLGYKRLRDMPPKAQEQQQQPAEAQ